MPTIEDIKNLRNQFDEVTNNPIALICDYLIQQSDTSDVEVEYEPEIPNTD